MSLAALKKIPPYRLIGWAFSVLLVIAVFIFYQLRSGNFGGFALGAMIACSVAVLLMVALEIGTLVRDYRRGDLFPMRNATFFVACLSVVALPVLGVMELLGTDYFHPSTLLLFPVFLWMCVRNLFRVKIDNVSFTAKTGFRAPVEVPLFRIARVTEDERSIDVTTDEGKTIRLLRPFFFNETWRRLRERLKGLG